MSTNAGASTSKDLKAHHSTRASKLSHDTAGGTYMTSQYLDLTFAVLVEYNGIYKPMVLAIDEDPESLFQDIRHLFDAKDDPKKNREMKVTWGHGSPKHGPGESKLDSSNITALLRLVKSRNRVDLIATSKYSKY